MKPTEHPHINIGHTYPDAPWGTTLPCRRNIILDAGITKDTALVTAFSLNEIQILTDKNVPPGRLVRISLPEQNLAAWGFVSSPPHGDNTLKINLKSSSAYPPDDLLRNLLIRQNLPSKRKSTRIPYKMPVTVYQYGRTVTALVRNISCAGAQLFTLSSLKRGLLHLSFEHLDLRVKGEIVAITDAKLYGVAFKELSPSGKRTLADFLLTLLRAKALSKAACKL